jgi:oligogalacturonide transporter
MIANRKSHSFALIIGLFIWGIATFLFNFHTPLSSNILVYLNCFLIGAGLSSAVVMPWSMLPFVTDVDILITAKKRAGTYAGAMTLTRKLIQGALVLPLMGLILKVIDYQTPTQAQIQAKAILTQSPETLAKMKFMFIVMPLTTIIIGIIASLFFKINKNTHTVLMNEIERLDKGGKKEDVTPETKKVCEMLTGMKYEKLYK